MSRKRWFVSIHQNGRFLRNTAMMTEVEALRYLLMHIPGPLQEFCTARRSDHTWHVVTGDTVRSYHLVEMEKGS